MNKQELLNEGLNLIHNIQEFHADTCPQDSISRLEQILIELTTVSKPVTKVKKGDRILDDGYLFYVVKKGKGYGDDETRLTLNHTESLLPAFDKYATHPHNSEILVVK